MSHSRLIWLVIACAALTVALAPAAGARTLGPGDAEAAARAAVTPEPVEAVRCFLASRPRGGADRRRGICLVAHPAPEGTLCRSLVTVRAPRGAGSIRARVVRAACIAAPAFEL